MITALDISVTLIALGFGLLVSKQLLIALIFVAVAYLLIKLFIPNQQHAKFGVYRALFNNRRRRVYGGTEIEPIQHSP